MQGIFDIELVRLVGVIVGMALVGEYRRSVVNNGKIFYHEFISNFLTSLSLSLLISYAFYLVTDRFELTYILAGLLGFQSPTYLESISTDVISKFLERLTGKNSGGKKND